MTESFQVPIDLRGFEVEIGVSKSVQDFRIFRFLANFRKCFNFWDVRCTCELFEPKAPLAFGGSYYILIGNYTSSSEHV